VVSNEGEIVVGTATGNLYWAGSGAWTIPADYPVGYQAFYCMKYEITQGQYADFLNMLDPPVAATYFPNLYNASRHTITYTNDEYTADAPDRACNYIDNERIYVYLDWAGLRPMSELEFEKLCRGVRAPLANEYVWGTTAYLAQTNQAGTDGSGTETATPTNANVHINTAAFNGPVRAGVFARADSTRELAGAGYYGVLDLGGNMLELVININVVNGRNFTDTYGDGSEYTARPATWPWPTSSTPVGGRGGHVGGSAGLLRTSDRATVATAWLYLTAHGYYGGRGVRTAP